MQDQDLFQHPTANYAFTMITSKGTLVIGEALFELYHHLQVGTSCSHSCAFTTECILWTVNGLNIYAGMPLGRSYEVSNSFLNMANYNENSTL